MGIVIGLIPALLWGFVPLILNRFVKDSSYVQMQGIGIGIAVVSVITTIITQPAAMTVSGWLLCFLSGIGWMIGMFGQLIGYQTIGVSRTFPLSTGIQIIGNAVLGWLVLGEWQGARQILLGLLFIAVIMAGILISNGTDQDKVTSRTQPANKVADRRYIIIVALTSFGYCLYSLLPRLSQSPDSFSESLPQSLGIMLSGIMITLIFQRRDLLLSHRRMIFPSIAVGTIYGIASLVFLISTAVNGMIRGFLLSQLNMIIATLSGIYILKEPQKTALWKSYAGMACILIGCIAIQFI